MTPAQKPAPLDPLAEISDHGKYVYYSGKGVKSVQWRQAALDMCAERNALLAECRRLRATEARLRGALEAALACNIWSGYALEKEQARAALKDAP